MDPDQGCDIRRLECFSALSSRRFYYKVLTLFSILNLAVQDHILVLNWEPGIGAHFRDIIVLPFQVDNKFRPNIVNVSVIQVELLKVNFRLFKRRKDSEDFRSDRGTVPEEGVWRKLSIHQTQHEADKSRQLTIICLTMGRGVLHPKRRECHEVMNLPHLRHFVIRKFGQKLSS